MKLVQKGYLLALTSLARGPEAYLTIGKIGIIPLLHLHIYSLDLTLSVNKLIALSLVYFF